MGTWFATLKTYSVAGLAVLLLLVTGYAILQNRWLDETVRQRDDASAERDAAHRAINELKTDAEATAVRETTVRSAREGIISAPVDDEAPVSSVLLQGLRGADAIGGAQ